MFFYVRYTVGNMKKNIITILSILFALSIVAFVVSVRPLGMRAAGGDSTGQAWSSNIGWVDFGNTGGTYGVKMQTSGTSRMLSGYAWSSNIGWISFDTTATTGCPSGDCQARVEWGTTGGPGVLLKGFARACSVFTSGCSGSLKASTELGGWDGFISLGDSKPTDAVNYGVKLNTISGNATGFAWGSQVVGWLDFTGIKFDVTGSVSYCADGVTPVPSGGLGACPSDSGSCSDGQQNQNETGVDTGGVCASCALGTSCYCADHPTDLQNCPSGTASCSDGTPAPNGDINQCPGGVGGICSNIPDATEQTLIAQGILTNPVTSPYRKTSDGKCLCESGYILNPITFMCTKPVYTEH